ncbi:lipid A-modifier LpxR family protein [Sulfitobacter sp. HNIBRBA3233]|uniref:lipid A-modifier LpxR family protein n=1 Tax=Sulfitobacter marinivivus TaxID=3158558 RepID=UPI0032DE9A43
MLRSLLAALVGSCFLAVGLSDAAMAQDRNRLGYGRLMSNDYIGDGKDRWRTGSWTSSRVWGKTDWQGSAPSQFGDLVELRLSFEILAPENLSAPAVGDRPYAGSLSVGAHTHFDWNGLETSMGADLVFTGSGTGLGKLQQQLHEAFGVDAPSEALLDAQIGGGLHPTVVAELGRTLDLGPALRLRPFVEGRAGAETMVRAGMDLTIGRIGQGEFMVRESVTGHRYRVIQNSDTTGFSFLLGADVAHVADSIYLPEDRGYELTPSRDRLRAGVHWQGRTASAFYGLTYLSEEFEAQTEGQLTGSVRINLSF